MHGQGRVTGGQTLVLSGLTSGGIRKFKDKVAVLGDIPVLGRLYRSEGRASQTKTLSVFVRVTLVDPAGNPIHAAYDTSARIPVYGDQEVRALSRRDIAGIARRFNAGSRFRAPTSPEGTADPRFHE